jgi:3-hydroxy-9,10-secoandrosta-1,3,5(10)-triene-9,17-dione monooxygenase reductase component
MVLFSLALDSTCLDAFRMASWWAVHVLAADQEALSNRFATRDADKFAGQAYTRGPGGVPLLDGFAARFVCRSAFEYEGGDHAIFLGEVQQVEQAGRTPLVYHKGRYGGVLPSSGAREADNAATVESLAEHGLVTFAGQVPKLSPRGQDFAAGLAAMAEADDRFSRHERAALKTLLSRLAD